MVPSCACSYQHSTNAQGCIPLEFSLKLALRSIPSCALQLPRSPRFSTPPLNSRRPLDPAWVLFPVLHLVSCLKAINLRDFPGGLMVKTPCFQCRGHRFYPWLENYMPCSTVKKKKLQQSLRPSSFIHYPSESLPAMLDFKALENFCFIRLVCSLACLTIFFLQKAISGFATPLLSTSLSTWWILNI